MTQMPKFDFGEAFVGLERGSELYLWKTKKLWDLSKSLPVFEYEVESFECFDKDVWFAGQHLPTLKNVLEHYKKIDSAHFEHPIILSHDGKVLDGVHRICKAHLQGRKTIPAVQFAKDPEPDRKHLLS